MLFLSVVSMELNTILRAKLPSLIVTGEWINHRFPFHLGISRAVRLTGIARITRELCDAFVIEHHYPSSLLFTWKTGPQRNQGWNRKARFAGPPGAPRE